MIIVKLLILSHGLWYGGAQVTLLNYLQLLRDRVSLIMVVCEGANQSFINDVKTLGITIVNVPCRLIQGLPLIYVDSAKSILKDVDLIWISDIEYLSAIELKRIVNKPIVAHLHSYALVCPWWALSYRLHEVCLRNCKDDYARFILCKVGRNSVRSEIEYYEYNAIKKLVTFIKGPLDFYQYRSFNQKY